MRVSNCLLRIVSILLVCLGHSGCHRSGGSSLVDSALVASVTNVGLAVDDVRLSGNLIVFDVDEAQQGGTDFNGDGDAADDVLHVYSFPSGTTVNLGVAVRSFDASGDAVICRVSESGQGGVDLNGDGDALDAVLHVYYGATGASSNLGLAAGRDARVDGDLVVFRVLEGAQGASDLNGDGDAEDEVLHVHELSSGVTTNLGLAIRGGFRLARGRVALTVSEAAQGGVDRNGDGDALDFVLAIFDVRARTLLDVGISVFVLTDVGEIPFLVFDGSLACFAVAELSEGSSDLNGDADAEDLVVHLYDVDGGLLTNLGLAVGPVGNFANIGESHVNFAVFESAQGEDLNGDGDLQDGALHIHDVQNGVTTNLALAGRSFRPAGDLGATDVPEGDQGATDLNADGDAGDTVKHLVFARTATVQNLGFATRNDNRPHLLGAGFFAFLVDESGQGAVDLNGDGDARDCVAHSIRLDTQEVTNLALAGGFFQSAAGRLAFVVFEGDQGEDLNGDGDLDDQLLHVFDAPTGRVVNLQLAGTGFDSVGLPQGFDGERLPLRVTEFGDEDLNGDGDDLDLVLHAVVLLPPATSPPPR